MAEQYSNKSKLVSHVAVHRKREPEECRFAARSTYWKRCGVHPPAAWFASPRPAALDNFDQEDAESEYEEDESQNDVWQAAFENEDEVEKSALHPRLGAMSVHMANTIGASSSAPNACGDKETTLSLARFEISWKHSRDVSRCC